MTTSDELARQELAGQRVARMRERIEAALSPSELEVEDQGHLHRGHAGAATGLGHFRVRVVSEKFRGMLPLARHRAVYAALGEMMESDIHALTIEASAGE